MKVGFDISQTGNGKAGCGYYADGLIRALAARDTRTQYLLYPAVGDVFWDPDCSSATFRCDRPNFQCLKAPRDFESSQNFWRADETLEARLGHPDIVHVNNFFCPAGLKTTRLVYTHYDLSFIEQPEWTTEANRVACFHGVFHAGIHADWIVTISESSRTHFLRTFPHFPAGRITVIYPASRFHTDAGSLPRPPALERLEPGNFWLAVSTLEPRKNLGRLLEAYRIVRAETGSPHPLVIAGGKGWLMQDFQAHADPGVMLPGYVDDAALSWLYGNCFAFVYPSLFEGFGMPVLEAMEMGAAVVASNTTSLPEVAGDAAILVDPLDPSAIAAGMLTLMRDLARRDRFRQAGRERARLFSWDKSAAELEALYERVLHLPRRGSRASCAAPPGP